MEPMESPGRSALIESLRRTRLWREAPDSLLEAAAERLERKRFERGDILIRQGQDGTHLHVVESGRVEVRVGTDDGTTVPVATLGTGECFGEMSLLTGEPASADVVAAEEVETLTLDAEAFRALVSQSPELLRQFVGILSQRLTRTDLAVSAAREKERHLTHFLRDIVQLEDGLVGSSRRMKVLRREIERFGATDDPLLVWGELGTGKELVARLVHSRSRRRDSLALAADCAQIAETEWGDRLFGARGTPGGRGRVPSHLDIAEGGTLVLNDLERLPAAVQERLARFLEAREGDAATAAQDVRIIATCRSDPAALSECGQLSAALVAAFGENLVAVPPLRERKRDIPELARHYLAKHAARLGKKAAQLEDEAVTKLVSYDYRMANDLELEQAVERAVILADGETIRDEEIFLGQPAAARPSGWNLLRIPGIDPRALARYVPLALRITAAAFFAFILYEAFFGPRGAQGNLATVLAWTLWWPLLALSFLMAGRLWCSVCPMGQASLVGQRIRKPTRRVPTWLKNHDFHLAMGGMFAIFLVEEATDMRHSPFATGILLLAILFGAVAVGLLYPRKAWCRHVCPLGGLAGVCGTSGLIELRPTFDICSAKCTGHSCYKGTEDVAGCPMSNHVMFVDSNQHCVLCLDCVRACPNGSPQLNLRLPGRELGSGTTARPEFGLFVLLLLGLLFGMAILQFLDRTALPGAPGFLARHRALLAIALLSVSTAIPLVAVRLVQRSLALNAEPGAIAGLWSRVATLAPIAATGLLAYQIEYLPGLEWMTASIRWGAPGSETAPSLSVPVLAIVRAVLLAAGLVTTAALLWRITRAGDAAKSPPAAGSRVRRLAGLLLAPAGYTLLLLLILVAP
jgi:transcriptional regulator with AAA-type ATPase domain/polyferredoxin